MICPKCGATVADGSTFCGNCGAGLGAAPTPTPQPTPAPIPQPVPAPQPMVYVDPTDHTNEYDPKDISDNKVIAMLPYLIGTVGIIVALLASKESPYTYFHVRQALKLTVVNILVGIITALLCWTVIVPIVGMVAVVVLFVIRIICFFQVCNGTAKEPAIISSLGFLK